MRADRRWMGLLGVSLVILCGCERMARSYWLGKYDRAIQRGTRAIETAGNDAERAHGYAERARGYSEKARYSRSFKLIPLDEYVRLFDLAVTDHDQAVALAPGDAEVYLSRGWTYHDRAVLEDAADPKSKTFFELAKADFTRAIERDGRNEQAFDMRGLVHTETGDLDHAISDFAEEMKINPRAGRSRLAEAYCTRGSFHQREKEYDLAIADYEESIRLGASSDGCNCDPYGALAWLYFDAKRQYDKSWDVVHKAEGAKGWIDPEFLEKLKKASGRSN